MTLNGGAASRFWHGVRKIDDRAQDMVGRLMWAGRSRSEIRAEIGRLIAHGEQLLEQDPPATYADLALSEFHRRMNRIDLLIDLAEQKRP